MKVRKESRVTLRGQRSLGSTSHAKVSTKAPSRRKIAGVVEAGKRMISPLAASLLETAGDMHDVGIMRDADYEKITMRHLGRMGDIMIVRKISGLQIRKMREEARMSQSVFAKVLNITPGYVSQMERGEKEPTGSTLAMLNVIKRKGINSVLE